MTYRSVPDSDDNPVWVATGGLTNNPDDALLINADREIAIDHQKVLVRWNPRVTYVENDFVWVSAISGSNTIQAEYRANVNNAPNLDRNPESDVRDSDSDLYWIQVQGEDLPENLQQWNNRLDDWSSSEYNGFSIYAGDSDNSRETYILPRDGNTRLDSEGTNLRDLVKDITISSDILTFKRVDGDTSDITLPTTTAGSGLTDSAVRAIIESDGSLANESDNGTMSSADKQKLDLYPDVPDNFHDEVAAVHGDKAVATFDNNNVARWVDDLVTTSSNDFIYGNKLYLVSNTTPDSDVPAVGTTYYIIDSDDPDLSNAADAKVIIRFERTGSFISGRQFTFSILKGKSYITTLTDTVVNFSNIPTILADETNYYTLTSVINHSGYLHRDDSDNLSIIDIDFDDLPSVEDIPASTADQVLTSVGDGTASWVTPTSNIDSDTVKSIIARSFGDSDSELDGIIESEHLAQSTLDLINSSGTSYNVEFKIESDIAANTNIAIGSTPPSNVLVEYNGVGLISTDPDTEYTITGSNIQFTDPLFESDYVRIFSIGGSIADSDNK